MAHHEDERTTMHGVLDMLVENGLEGMADAMATMLNEAMKIDRSTAPPLFGRSPESGLLSVSDTPTALSRRGFRVERDFSIYRSHKSGRCLGETLSSSIRRAWSAGSEASRP